MGSVTAKVFLSNRVDVDAEQTKLDFYADYNDGRNKEWAKYTPALNLTMTVKKEIADKHFPTGGHFTLTFDLDEKEGSDGGNSTA